MRALNLTHPIAHCTQEELVLVQTARADGSSAQILFRLGGTVTAQALEQLCVKVGLRARILSIQVLIKAAAGSRGLGAERAAGQPVSRCFGCWHWPACVLVRVCLRDTNGSVSARGRVPSQVGWPSRPLAKVDAALRNSFLVCSLVLRITRGPPNGDQEPIVISETLIGEPVQHNR